MRSWAPATLSITIMLFSGVAPTRISEESVH